MIIECGALVMIDKHIARKAYKKLKANVYHDKTMPLLRHEIVKFESKYGEIIDEYLDDIYNWFKDEEKFQTNVRCILNKIDIVPLPKTLKKDVKDNIVISNCETADCEVEHIQYFIDMPVEGHILGTLWVMLIGCYLDKSLNKHVYGNRISEYLVNDYEKYSNSTYLFEPYFVQYESWRDKGLQCAENITANKNNAIIITMDLERYYYSLDINNKVMNSMLADVPMDNFIECKKNIYTLLNKFVGDVIAAYASKLANKFDNRKILPIGFLPSNIISNWFLKEFDKAVLDVLNPAYYGRYVDDILIVDSIDDDSYIGGDTARRVVTNEDVIDLYLASCNRSEQSNRRNVNCCNSLYKLAYKRTVEENNVQYVINPQYYSSVDNKSCLKFNLSKAKLFYFNWQESKSLITCFKKQIARNKSEFRHMPDEEAFRRDDYTDIYTLVNEAGLNKLRGIKDFEIDKFELSKFIGKYLRICAMIDVKATSKFEKDILEIFSRSVALENYTLWEKIIEIFVIKENYDGLKQFCDRVRESIDSLSCEVYEEFIKKRLYQILHVDLCRCLALVWKDGRIKAQYSLDKCFQLEGKEDVDKSIMDYCKTRMIDKYVMPIIFDMLEFDELTCDKKINLTSLDDCLKYLKKEWDDSYKYFPYRLRVIDFCFISNLEHIFNHAIDSNRVNDIFGRYHNYNRDNNKIVNEYHGDDNIRFVVVDNDKKDVLKIAIANVVLNDKEFERVIFENRNRSYDRYRSLSRIVNDAVDSKADMLIMPEAYVPYEWLPVLAQTSKKEQLAIVAGVEHFKLAGKIYNFTAVILPYEDNKHKDAYISFHLKNHYAPFEIELILGYNLTYETGNGYELYRWNGCYFPVYCCYELASIKDRALFQSKADFIVAVEWNRDVKYYSNIAESLSRDMHCYFVQVNSADYGDSRIVKPTKDAEKDLIRTKGGINSSVLVDTIDIKKLRDFQMKQYNLQKQDGSFKVTPPNLSRETVRKKIDNMPLWI